MTSVLQTIFDAIMRHEWQPAAAAALIGAVSLTRAAAGLPWTGKAGAFLKSDRGGALLVLLLGVLGGMANAFGAKQDVTPQIIGKGIITGLVAAGGWNVVKRIFFPQDTASAPTVAPPIEKVALLLVLFGTLMLCA